jgi:nucleotide-binding universal stress UspA family protein
MNTSRTLGSVMVGVDGSSSSDLALAWAVRHAEANRRPLAIVHAAGTPVVTDFALDLTEARRGLRMAGRRVTDHALGLVRASAPALDVSVDLALRDPRDLLAELAVDASVLVLGTRGHGTVAGLLLGSVSVALTAHAPCPVVVVRPAPASDAPDELPVVVGVDGTEDSAGAITFAFELAAEQHRRLEVVHATGDAWVIPAPMLVSPEMVEEVLADQRLLLAESMAGYAEKFPDVVVHSRLVRGSPAQALVDSSQVASAVVVGARGRSAAKRRLLGSVSRSVVEHAHCTVVVVRGGLT